MIFGNERNKHNEELPDFTHQSNTLSSIAANNHVIIYFFNVHFLIVKVLDTLHISLIMKMSNIETITQIFFIKNFNVGNQFFSVLSIEKILVNYENSYLK